MSRPPREVWADMVKKLSEHLGKPDCPTCTLDDATLNLWSSVREAGKELRADKQGESLHAVASAASDAIRLGLANEEELTVASLAELEFSEDANELLDAHEAHMLLSHSTDHGSFAQA